MGTTAAEITSELSLLSVVLRLAFATFIGALVGVERTPILPVHRRGYG